ncbi:MAG: protein kinase [Nannocystaceae bacterium]
MGTSLTPRRGARSPSGRRSLLPDGYTLRRKMYEGSRTRVYRAIRDEDGAPVVIKMTRGRSPSSVELSRLRREHALLARLRSEHIVRALALEESPVGLALVLEDFGGASLRRVLEDGPLPVDRWIDTALQVARGLAVVHAQQIIHADIKPDNVIANAATGRTALGLRRGDLA